MNLDRRQMQVQPQAKAPHDRLEVLPKFCTNQFEQISDPYINVEIKHDGLMHFCVGLAESLSCSGVVCELASESAHVSIAYGHGLSSMEQIEHVASQIAHEKFSACARHFEMLEGLTTPFHYLVLALDGKGDFRRAVEKVEDRLQTRKFEGGFKSHVSLLKFEKGTFDAARASELVRELNASHGAAFALGQALEVKGHCVCVYSGERQPILRVGFDEKPDGDDHRRWLVA